MNQVGIDPGREDYTVAQCSVCGSPTKILDEHFFPEDRECSCEEKKDEQA